MKKTLVIGASTNEARYSNMAIHKLRSNGHDVVAVGAREGEVADITFSSEKKPFEDVHTVTMYVGAKHQPDYYDYILSLNPSRIIFNPGTQNPDFYPLLEENDIEVLIACTLVLLSTDQY